MILFDWLLYVYGKQLKDSQLFLDKHPRGTLPVFGVHSFTIKLTTALHEEEEWPYKYFHDLFFTKECAGRGN